MIQIQEQLHCRLISPGQYNTISHPASKDIFATSPIVPNSEIAFILTYTIRQQNPAKPYLFSNIINSISRDSCWKFIV